MKKKFTIVFCLFMLFASYSTGAFAAESTSKDIVDIAVESGDFEILVAALKKAELVETLKGNGPFTVFAPTDDAFKKLLKDLNITAEELLAREDLKKILLYHVVSGKVLSTDLKDGMKVKTLADQEVTISLNPVKVNDAKVIKPDVEASNGVIHVVDKVLLP
ncbi:fasciclin domain-containing protein [Bacillus pinisoli]|uniref:fasciclin domain-containing protein n=1 Tax=Bacillus pinisoli TaxID=2901866 RepID=UPI001FF56A20|nr:fasciclin domain-containing protein [Bacillus pinisoli]